jgi:hypothetical protein
MNGEKTKMYAPARNRTPAIQTTEVITATDPSWLIVSDATLLNNQNNQDIFRVSYEFTCPLVSKNVVT